MSGPTETVFTLLVFAGVLATGSALLIPESTLGRLVRRFRLPLAALVAVGATLGSLYFSEVRNYTPCELCWYQRIAMYPLGLVLAIAAVRRDEHIVPYAATMAGIGAAISAYHYQLQVFPDQGTSCDVTNPCSLRWIEVFGFVSIPLLALGCFLAVLGLLFCRPIPPSTSPTGADKESLHA